MPEICPPHLELLRSAALGGWLGRAEGTSVSGIANLSEL